STRAVLCRTTWPLALMSPWTSPEMITTCDLMVAVTEPLSPTISVFSLEISPSKRPSIRTVSLKDSLPENSEPWSMNAVSAPTPPALAAGAFIAGSSLPPLRNSLKPIGAHSRSDRSLRQGAYRSAAPILENSIGSRDILPLTDGGGWRRRDQGGAGARARERQGPRRLPVRGPAGNGQARHRRVVRAAAPVQGRAGGRTRALREVPRLRAARSRQPSRPAPGRGRRRLDQGRRRAR